MTETVLIETQTYSATHKAYQLADLSIGAYFGVCPLYAILAIGISSSILSNNY